MFCSPCFINTLLCYSYLQMAKMNNLHILSSILEPLNLQNTKSTRLKKDLQTFKIKYVDSCVFIYNISFLKLSMMFLKQLNWNTKLECHPLTHYSIVKTKILNFSIFQEGISAVSTLFPEKMFGELVVLGWGYTSLFGVGLRRNKSID